MTTDAAAAAAPVDETALELGRLGRLREALAAAGCDAGVFYDPTNVRYATGTSNMQVYSLHNPCRYAFVPVDGPVVLFDFKGCEHLSDAHPAVDEVRSAVSWYHFVTGSRTEEFACRWADEIATLLGVRRAGGGDRRRLAVDRLDPAGHQALARHGVDVVDGQQVANLARVVKTPDEIVALRGAVQSCETAIAAMSSALRPGITEQQLWAELHRAAIADGAEWFETRLLTSGPRTNPWYQECSDRVIEHGDLVAFDTDLIGRRGYSVDVSRTWLAGDGRRSGEQRTMFAAAHEQVAANIGLLRAGLTFREFADAAVLPPGRLHTRTNAALAHGIGLCNEYPLILNRDHFDEAGYDGVIEEGMVLCVESLVAPEGGREAVKLEEQVLITATGAEPLSTCPYDERLCA